MRIDINNFKRLDVNCRYAFFFFFVENIIGNGGMGWCCMVGIRYRELELRRDRIRNVYNSTHPWWYSVAPSYPIKTHKYHISGWRCFDWGDAQREHYLLVCRSPCRKNRLRLLRTVMWGVPSCVPDYVLPKCFLLHTYVIFIFLSFYIGLDPDILSYCTYPWLLVTIKRGKINNV